MFALASPVAFSLLIGVGSYGAERIAEESRAAFSVSPPLLEAEGLVDACAAVLVVGVTIGVGSCGEWRSRGCADWVTGAPFAVGFGTTLPAPPPDAILPWTMGFRPDAPFPPVEAVDRAVEVNAVAAFVAAEALPRNDELPVAVLTALFAALRLAIPTSPPLK